MNTPPSTLTLRRRPLLHALGELPPLYSRVLFALALRADPRNGRAWFTLDAMATEIGLTQSLLRTSIEQLVAREFVSTIPTYRLLVWCVELGPLLVRESAPPPNLPVAPAI